MNNIVRHTKERAFERLAPRDYFIYCARTGLGQDKCTLKELSKVFGLCQERVRQISKAAERKLNQPSP